MEILSERKKAILQAIIEDYISTAEPVGSRNIAKTGKDGANTGFLEEKPFDD